jgi:hypothetical protein
MPDPLASVSNACSKPDGSCDGRTHFVIHQTVDGKLTEKKIKDLFGGKKGKGHQYILKSGKIVRLFSLDEPGVFATKAETSAVPLHGKKPSFALKGKMIHTEVDYEDGGEPNKEQYAALRDLYIEACQHVGRILTIVPHIEVDRGIKNGHSDPQNFLYNDFYALLKAAGISLGNQTSRPRSIPTSFPGLRNSLATHTPDRNQMRDRPHRGRRCVPAEAEYRLPELAGKARRVCPPDGIPIA